jgi:hypothetical protein
MYYRPKISEDLCHLLIMVIDDYFNNPDNQTGRLTLMEFQSGIQHSLDRAKDRADYEAWVNAGRPEL